MREQQPQAALEAAQHDIDTVTEQLAAAKAKLSAADQKRRALALAAHTGVTAAHKALKAATSERDDARTLCEDLDLALSAAREKRSNLEMEIETDRHRQRWAQVVEHGLKRAACLSRITDLRDRLFAECETFLLESQRARILSSRVNGSLVSPEVSVVLPSLEGRFKISSEFLADVISATMPRAIFDRWAGRQMPHTDAAIDREVTFWQVLNIGETENEQKATA